jgi:L-rhamnose mutarotase
MATEHTTHRVGFWLQVNHDIWDDCVEAHRHVWPETLDALRDFGSRNYSLSLDRADGTLFGCPETFALDTSPADISKCDVNACRHAPMAVFLG